jgi:hypothetical protein
MQLAEEVRKALDSVFEGFILQAVSPGSRPKCGELRLTLDSSPEEFLLSARLWQFRLDCSNGPQTFEPFPFPEKLRHQRTPNEGNQGLLNLTTWLRQALNFYLSTNMDAMRAKVYAMIPFGQGARLLLPNPGEPYTADKFQTVLPVRKFDNADRAEAKFFAWNSFRLDFFHGEDRHELFLRGKGCAADMDPDATPPTPPAPSARGVRAVPDHFRDQESLPLSTLLPRLVGLSRENLFYLQPGDSGQSLATPNDCNVVAAKDN